MDPSTQNSTQRLMASFVRQTLERLDVAALLDHPGETGRAREKALRDHLRSFLPPSLGVSTGFIIDAHGGRSRQIDIIIHFADYHAVFTVNGIPLVPVEAVIAVFEIKSFVTSQKVLHDCYDVLKSVKELDRSNDGRNLGLIDREPVPVDWQDFQWQVFGAVLSVESCTRDLWLDATHEWCTENDRHLWPNFYCGVNDYIGTYHARNEGNMYTSANTIEGVMELVAFWSDDESPLAWATQEILNFVRVAKRVDYSPTSYLSGGTVDPDKMKTKPLP